jgi:hypothetical protein
MNDAPRDFARGGMRMAAILLIDVRLEDIHGEAAFPAIHRDAWG